MALNFYNSIHKIENTVLINENMDCPFCKLDETRKLIIQSEAVFAIFDKFPVSNGHALIIPKRHCSNYFELSLNEQIESWNLLSKVKDILTEALNPDGFNIGININESAGQTVPHVHIHLIPRYKGDVVEPRGGVRGVIPDKRDY
ncbi:MAG: HIT family protein [Ferruginibacter sp.]